MANPLCCVFWFLVLFTIAFIVACFCAPFYILFYPITACISGCAGITDFLLQGVQFPGYCAHKMVNCEGC